jgi:WD40 repeat protein
MATAWRTVRVFISSTFKDMQAERDYLVRFVFPRLREALIPRRIHLLDVDLRWGLTSEQDALSVSKEIIDECRPRFLCILGGRYGWTPPGKEESITAAEIHFAALHRPRLQEYRFFYFRDPQVTEAIPDAPARKEGYREYPMLDEIEKYGPDEAEARSQIRAEKLRKLKQDIINAGFFPKCYSAHWDEPQQRLIDLQAFGEQIYEDLLWSIDDELGTEVPPDLDEFEAENAAMEAFIEERLAGYVVGSRQPVLDDLTTFTEADGEPNVLVLTGEAGSGKSALLSKFSRDYASSHPYDLLISHFVGASIGSTDLFRSLRRLCHELSPAMDAEAELPQDTQRLLSKFAGLLEQTSASRRVVLLIDALNQMDAADNAHFMHWLPYQLQPSVRVIISSLDHPALEALRKRGNRVREEGLMPLTSEDAHEIISGFVRRYHKNLEHDQVGLLLSKADHGNPLYLIAALEELRTLGTYEEITERIKELPSRLEDLFVWIFHRLENDPGFRDASGKRIGSELVRSCASLLAVSRHGLSQMEIMELVSSGESASDPPFPLEPQGNVAALVRLVRPYLMQRGEYLDFYHNQFRRASEATYLVQENDRIVAHRQLADYFRHKADPAFDSTWVGNHPRGLLEFPYHLANSLDWLSFRNTLTNFLFLKAKIGTWGIHEIISDYDLNDLPIWGNSKEESEAEAIRLIKEALLMSSHIIDIDRNQLAGQLTGRLKTIKNCLIQEFLTSIRHGEKGPWLRLLTGSINPPGGALIRTLITAPINPDKAMAITPDGNKALYGSDWRVYLIDLEQGTELRSFTLKGTFIDGDGLREIIYIDSVAISPDGTRALYASHGNYPQCFVKIVDLESGEEKATIEEHAFKINFVTFTPDGMGAAVSSENLHDEGDLTLWDLKNRRRIGYVSSAFTIPLVAIRCSGRQVLFVSDRWLEMWEPEKGRETKTIGSHEKAIYALAVTPDGSKAITGSDDNNLKVWGLDEPEELLTLISHSGPINSIAITPDGNYAVSASEDKTLKIWDLTNGSEVGCLRGHNGSVVSVHITANGKRAISGAKDNTIRIWDLSRIIEKKIQPSICSLGEITAISVINNDKQVVLSNEKQFQIWNLGNGVLSKTINHNLGSIKIFAVTPDGKRAISISKNEYHYDLKLWDLRDGELFNFIIHGQPLAAAISPGGDRIVSISSDEINVWELETRHNLRVEYGLFEEIEMAVVTPDGHWGAFIVQKLHPRYLAFWDLHKLTQIHNIKIGSSPSDVLAITPDGRRALLSDHPPNRDGVIVIAKFVRVWDLQTGVELYQTESLADISLIATSSDGYVGIAGSNLCIMAWDISSGLTINKLRSFIKLQRKDYSYHPPSYIFTRGGLDLEYKRERFWKINGWGSIQPIAHIKEIRSLKVTNNRLFAISVSEDGFLIVWDLTIGMVVASFTGDSPFTACDISSDGKTIILGNSVGEVHIFRLEGVGHE